MDRRRTAQRPAGGGGGIQATRTPHARLALAAGSTLAYAAAIAHAVLLDARATPFVGPIGGAGAALLVLALARRQERAVPWSLVLAGLAYAAALIVHGSRVDSGAPLVAAALFLSAELAAWSLDERHAIAAERAVWLARAIGVAALTGAGLLAAGLLTALSLAPGNGLAWTVLGAAASVLAVGLAVQHLARRPA